VYRLHDEDLAALDCLTYLARAEPGKHVPSVEYMSALIAGSVENGLPEDYVSRLRAFGTTV
jgi:hypothetical protein